MTNELYFSNSTKSQHLFALLGLELTQVELELLALQDVAVGAARLAWPRADGGKNATSAELLLERRLDLGHLLPLVVLLLGLLGALLAQHGLFLLRELDALLAAERRGIVRLVPLTEWKGIDLHDGVLHERLGAHQLVVAGIVQDVNDTCLPRLGLRAPREVSSVKAKCPELLVSTASADGSDTLGPDLGVGGGSAELELPLLADRVHATTSRPPLVPLIARDTHFLFL